MKETNPTHYTAKGKECIVEMYEKFGHDAVMRFCQLNAYKYNYRQDHKGQTEQDVAKAKWYDTVYNQLRQGSSIYDALAFVRSGGVTESEELTTAKKFKVPTPEVCKLLNWDKPTWFVWVKEGEEWNLFVNEKFEDVLQKYDCVYAPQTDDIISILPDEIDTEPSSLNYYFGMTRESVGYTCRNKGKVYFVWIEKVDGNHYAQALALLYSKVKEVHHG